ncbi:outer membrane protein assembly factor BamE [Kingella kingae]|uniref:outer membrane protein assembly factor BamE n=1 Tax=Kingella kingae TaxID=504 RepID=UPI001411E497|nr:outer membrane protein assembly factor BamE [Kingella kingae]QIP50806.1 outer membrane protein assembly factor BamE [Kingella kingae]
MKPFVLAVAALLGLNACTPTVVEKLPYYKLPVVQGIPLEAEAVLTVKIGMSRQQVAMEIGMPLLRPSFRQDRWDYFYQVTRGGKVKESRTLAVFFDANSLVSRIEGDALDYARQEIANKQQGTAQ